MNINKIALFGLGKLGLPLSLVFSQKLNVVGIDVDDVKVNTLKKGIIPFFEPGLNEYLESGYNNIEFKNINDYDINNIDVAIILVNTPSDENGGFSNKYIYDVIQDLSKKIINKKDFLFIVSSTVMPESHDTIIEMIESITNKKLNNGFGYVYTPDLVALGSVINDFENPDLLIMGESNKTYGDVAENIYKKIIKNNAPIVRMSLIESEISKISLNAYITMKISFFNFIGNISDKFMCNPNNISKALGFDRRISPYYNKSGLAFGGTCFPRDTWAFIEMSKKLGLDAVHIKATQKINDEQNILLYEKVKMFKDKKIGVVGLSFKPDTIVTTESPGNILYEKLLKEGFNVVAFDDIIDTGYTINDINNCDVVVLTHNKKEHLLKVDINKIIINPWHI